MYIKWCQGLNRRRSGWGPHGDSCRENSLREVKTNPFPLDWQVADGSPYLSLARLTQVMRERQYYPYREWCTYHFPGWLIEDCNLDRSLSPFDYSRPSTARKTRWVHGLLGAPTMPSAATALPWGPQQSPYHLYSGHDTWMALRQRLTDTYRFIRLPRSLYFIRQNTQRTRKLQKIPLSFQTCVSRVPVITE